MTAIRSHRTVSQPATYHILVQGVVGVGWQDWFDGMSLSIIELPEEGASPTTDSPEPIIATLLRGELADQAALMGALQRLYSFGLPILKVELVSL